MVARRPLRSPVPSRHPLLLEWWTDLEGDNRSVNTRLAYVRDVQQFAEYVENRLEQATPEDLIRFGRRMTEAGLSVGTRARRITALRRFYEWFRRRQHEPFSVAQDLKPPRRLRRVHRWWTEEQVAQFRAAFAGDDARVLRDRAMAELGLMGLRVSEVTRLDIERVVRLGRPDDASIVVSRKGGKEQVLPLTGDARAALLLWLAVRPVAPTTALFFRIPFQPRRARLHYASVEKIFKRYAARARVPDSRRHRVSPPAPHGRSADGEYRARDRGGTAPARTRESGHDPGLLRGDRRAPASGGAAAAVRGIERDRAPGEAGGVPDGSRAPRGLTDAAFERGAGPG